MLSAMLRAQPVGSPPLAPEGLDGALRADGLTGRSGPVRVIVAAAGRGTRFSDVELKVVAPGRIGVPLVVRVLAALAGLDHRPVVVVNEWTAGRVRQVIDRAGLTAELVVQDSALSGMGGAILTALRQYPDGPSDVVTAWADMGMVWAPHVWATVAVHQALGSPMSFPTKLRSAPYVCLLRDERGAPYRFLFARDGDAMPPVGESDCGSFVFAADRLGSALEDAARSQPGAEIGLLPLVEQFHRAGDPAYAVHIAASTDSQGVNTLRELEVADERYEIGIERIRVAIDAARDGHALREVLRMHGLPPPLTAVARARLTKLGLAPESLAAGQAVQLSTT